MTMIMLKQILTMNECSECNMQNLPSTQYSPMLANMAFLCPTSLISDPLLQRLDLWDPSSRDL